MHLSAHCILSNPGRDLERNKRDPFHHIRFRTRGHTVVFVGGVIDQEDDANVYDEDVAQFWLAGKRN